jgi:hypothetical protein
MLAGLSVLAVVATSLAAPSKTPAPASSGLDTAYSGIGRPDKLAAGNRLALDTQQK